MGSMAGLVGYQCISYRNLLGSTSLYILELSGLDIIDLHVVRYDTPSVVITYMQLI